jgi:hypothetical protein
VIRARRGGRREGLNLKGRSRRTERDAEAEKAGPPRRNDILPLLEIESYSVDALKSHARKLRKSDPVHVREIAAWACHHGLASATQSLRDAYRVTQETGGTL